MPSDTGGGVIIIRRKMTQPAFYNEDVPAQGVGKYLGKVQVWHLIVLSFVLGAVIF